MDSNFMEPVRFEDGGKVVLGLSRNDILYLPGTFDDVQVGKDLWLKGERHRIVSYRSPSPQSKTVEVYLRKLPPDQA